MVSGLVPGSGFGSWFSSVPTEDVASAASMLFITPKPSETAMELPRNLRLLVFFTGSRSFRAHSISTVTERANDGVRADVVRYLCVSPPRGLTRAAEVVYQGSLK